MPHRAGSPGARSFVHSRRCEFRTSGQAIVRDDDDRIPGQSRCHTVAAQWKYSGDERDRTVDLLLAKQALYQLSYVPI